MVVSIDPTNAFGLLFMTIGANFTGNLLSCDIQRNFTNSVASKHFIAFLLLFFFIVLSNKDAILKNKDNDDLVIPELLLNTVIVYMIFLICTKMEFLYSAVILSSVFIYMLLDIEKSNKTRENLKTIETAQTIIKYLAFAIGILGFSKYAIKQYNDHKQDFSVTKFLFGTLKCRDV
jgi:hypothetical protein